MKQIWKVWMVAVALTILGAADGAAQRKMDRLDRGLVAQKVTRGVFLSWRILGEEYYGVKYNVYRDGTRLNAEPLSVSNLTDASGTEESRYTVAAVVDGVEQAQCAAVMPWTGGYLPITLQPMYSRRGTEMTKDYTPNDISVADLDGDGQMEILVKRINELDTYGLFSEENDSAYAALEAYKLDGTRLWWIDVGPNMVSGTDVELNIVAFDWDEDGRSEVVLRGADNMYIHQADGTVRLVGQSGVNTRNTVGHTANYTYTNTGAEYLLYLNGTTGEPYQIIDYPLPRGNAKDWGDSHGHRSSKYFFGAPYLDGRKPSIFLARGIYTQHRMIALDVNPATHQLTTRWRWDSPMSGDWYGQGYHNFGIADVDWDGRDEICYGSMVIDDNGKGLSTTGFGHGDAQHCSDLDPFRHGQEIFACLEDAPGCNYRDATTSNIYFRVRAARDDGRCMAGNFSNKYFGAQLESTRTGGCFSSVTDKFIDGQTVVNRYTPGIALNFRCYWDGDLLEETFNYYNMDETGWKDGLNPCISKMEVDGAVTQFNGAITCNGSKGTPSWMGDLLGDWRDEFILRDATGNLRVYSTTIATKHRIYTTWHDHQYRQGMVWEMCGYNQPPHLSYFLGELEGITMAPPPLTTNDREEVTDGGTISTALNGKHVLLAETKDATFTLAEGAQPAILTVNAPSWVQGATNNDRIAYTYYTHTLAGAKLSGQTRLVKQGDGYLLLPDGDHTHTGQTDIWAGVVSLDGGMAQSRVWLNRFAELHANGSFPKSIEMNYAAVLAPGGYDKRGCIETDTLWMHYGSRLHIDLYADGTEADFVKANVLRITPLTRADGPQYRQPVLEFQLHADEGADISGRYLIAELGMQMGGSIKSFVIEGLADQKYTLEVEDDGRVYMNLAALRAPATIAWTGSESNAWTLAGNQNFLNGGEADYFVTGDNVVFNDEATKTAVSIPADIMPASVTFTGSKNFTVSGTGGITGAADLTMEGTGRLTLNNVNTYTGRTLLRGGTTVVQQIVDREHDTGALGAAPTEDGQFTIENGATLQIQNTVDVPYDITIGEGGGAISPTGQFDMHGHFLGQGILTKKGGGTLVIEADGQRLQKLIVEAGTLAHGDPIATGGFGDHYAPADTVELAGGTLQDPDNTYTYSTSHFPIVVRDGKKSTWNLDARCGYYNKVMGGGQLTINAHGYVRSYLYLDLSEFTGTLVAEGGLPLATGKGMPHGTLNLNGQWAGNNGQRFAIGKITGTGGLGGLTNGLSGGANTWVIGNESNFSWPGAIADNSNFEKVGTGKMTMTGKSTHTGTTTVEEGELHLGSAATLGTGKITVKKYAILSGVATLTNTSLTVNGILQIGSSAASTTGTLKFTATNATATFSSTSVLDLGITKATTATSAGCTQLAGFKTVTINGLIRVRLASSYDVAAGDSIQLVSATTIKGNPTFELPELPAGLYWDTADFIGKGLLRIAAKPVGINDLPEDETVNRESEGSQCYDLSGRTIGNGQRKMRTGQLSHGVYIMEGRKVLSTPKH